MKTYFIQQMLKYGFLASDSFYASFAHKEDHVRHYLRYVNKVFSEVKQATENDTLMTLIEGELCHTGFKRLN